MSRREGKRSFDHVSLLETTADSRREQAFKIPLEPHYIAMIPLLIGGIPMNMVPKGWINSAACTSGTNGGEPGSNTSSRTGKKPVSIRDGFRYPRNTRGHVFVPFYTSNPPSKIAHSKYWTHCKTSV